MEATTTTTAPSATQLLFARAVIYTFDLWPALRLAVSEQWGGVESKAKADFLISYLCDEYSEESSTPAPGQATATATTAVCAPTTPDPDDLAEILEGYFADEFESRLEDESADWAAARLVQLHKLIYAAFPPTQESLLNAGAELDKLEQATVALRGKKVTAQRTAREDEIASGSESESDSQDEQGAPDDAMEVDPPAPRSKPEPVVDEDGFTTVVKGSKRR